AAAWRCGRARRRDGRVRPRSDSWGVDRLLAVRCGWRLALRLVLLAITDHAQRPGRETARDAPMHPRILGAVRDPELGRARSRDRGAKPVPVGLIGPDPRQVDP